MTTEGDSVDSTSTSSNNRFCCIGASVVRTVLVHMAKIEKFGFRACAQSTSVFCHKRTRPWKSPQLSVYQI